MSAMDASYDAFLRREARVGTTAFQRFCTRKSSLHHKTYARLGREELRDLMPLCRACHLSEHHSISRGREMQRRAAANRRRFIDPQIIMQAR